MAEGASDVPRANDVFVVHSSEDDAIARNIISGLQREKLIVSDHTSEDSFKVGVPVFDSIFSAIERSVKVLLLVTKQCRKSLWVTLETLLTIEKSSRNQTLSLRLVVEGLTDDEMKSFKTGDLEFVPHYHVDFNKKDWAAELVKYINAPVDLPALLPAGNISHGLVFAYFIGYLRNILPGLEKAVVESDWYKQNPGHVSKRFLVLLPSTCRATSIETGAHDGEVIIKKEGAIYVDVHFGGNFRKFDVPLYSVTKDGETFFFPGEIPSILDTMARLIELNLIKLDVRMQIERFRVTLAELVGHRNNEKCNDTVSIVSYDDRETKPGTAILETLKADLQQLPSSQEARAPICWKTIKGQATASGPDLAVRIVHIDRQEDSLAATEICDSLLSHGMEMIDSDTKGDRPDMGGVNRFIIVLSVAGFRNKNLEEFYTEITKYGEKSFGIVPVVVGTTIDKVPARWRFVQLLIQKEDYVAEIWKIITGEFHLSEEMQAGDVATGLAYTFTVNYMSQNILGRTAAGKDLKGRFLDGMEKYGVSGPCLAIVFVLVPRSCSFPTQTSPLEGEEHLGLLEPAVVGTRKYFLHLFRLTLSSGQKICYAREYATPAITLHEMAHKYSFAGLSQPGMAKQARIFSDLVNNIVNNADYIKKVGDVRNNMKMVFFDDSEETVVSALEKSVQQAIKTEKPLQTDA